MLSYQCRLQTTTSREMIISINASRQQAEKYLLKEGHGSWPYHPEGDTSLETTAWCAIALRSDKTITEKTWQFYNQCQNSNGGWSTDSTDPNSDWTSNLVVLSLRVMAENLPLEPEKRSLLESGYKYLIKSRQQANLEFLRWIFRLLKLPANFPSGRGWPFVPGTVMLVEPTTYALMALKPIRHSAEEPLKSVIALAEEYLFNRFCQRGGWNYGENIRLTEQLPAYPVTTAQAIVALQDKPDNERIQTGVKFLTESARKDNTVMSLAWSALARDCLGLDARQELEMLAKQQRKDGSFGGNIYLTALSTCALQIEESNPLKFPVPATLEIQMADK